MSASKSALKSGSAHPAASRKRKSVTTCDMNNSNQLTLWHRAFRKHFALWKPKDVISALRIIFFTAAAALGGAPVATLILKALSSGL